MLYLYTFLNGLCRPYFIHDSAAYLNSSSSASVFVFGILIIGSPFRGSTTSIVSEAYFHCPFTKLYPIPGFDLDIVSGSTVDQLKVENGEYIC